MWSWLTKLPTPARTKVERLRPDAGLIDATLRSEEAYAVRIHNDDVTPMGFVVEALEASLRLDHQKAVQLMLQVHMHGSTDIGRMPLARAQEAAAAISELAQRHGQPLQCEVVQFCSQASPPASVA
jgi:ATP-dependent Clp protease adaptor protein ClpS